MKSSPGLQQLGHRTLLKNLRWWPGLQVNRQAKGHRCGCGQGYWALATEVQCTPSQDAEGGALKITRTRIVLDHKLPGIFPRERMCPSTVHPGPSRGEWPPVLRGNRHQKRQTATTERNGSTLWVWGGQKPCIRGQITP